MGETDTERIQGSRDSRTLLPDRDSFYRDVTPMLGEADARGTSLVLLCVDIEGIDFALRTFGPFLRDDLVRQAGQRMHEALGNGSDAYHITQDRFALVLPTASHRQATRKAEALVAAIREPFELAGVSYSLNAHVGISHYPSHADSVNEWVRASVFACHQARQDRLAYAIYDKQRDNRERERFRLMVDLESALENQSQIKLAYQPIVESATGKCVGVEALCRWHHPHLGLIPPGRFLPFVEQTSLVLPLTEAVLATALRGLVAWRDRGFDGYVAVNLSPVLFRQPDLLDRLLEHFRFFNMELANIHFEITETDIIEQPNRGANMLMEIRDKGSRISIDDFGTGHSSLAYLADLPIDSIKIDKHFVQSLSRPWGEAVVGAACTLAHTLDLVTIAEGVENERTLQKARELGCDYVQGFHVGRPMFEDALEKWLEL